MYACQNWLEQIGAGFYRQPRPEQWLLLVSGVCLLAYLGYLVLLQPLQNLATREQQQAILARNSLSEMHQLALRLQQLQPAVEAPAVNLAELVDRSLRLLSQSTGE